MCVCIPELLANRSITSNENNCKAIAVSLCCHLKIRDMTSLPNPAQFVDYNRKIKLFSIGMVQKPKHVENYSDLDIYKWTRDL